LPYVLAECGIGPRERTKRPEIGGRIRTILEHFPAASRTRAALPCG
jgi:hypothetical protein